MPHQRTFHLHNSGNYYDGRKPCRTHFLHWAGGKSFIHPICEGFLGNCALLVVSQLRYRACSSIRIHTAISEWIQNLKHNMEMAEEYMYTFIGDHEWEHVHIRNSVILTSLYSGSLLWIGRLKPWLDMVLSLRSNRASTASKRETVRSKDRLCL